MTVLDVLLVAVVKGLGEVLPVGAAAHLTLIPAVMAAQHQRAAVAAAADLGVAAALITYFWRDVAAMALGLWRLTKGRVDAGLRLFLVLLVGTVPAILVGWLFARFAPGLGSHSMAAAAMLVFGLFLLVADRMGMTVCRLDHLGWPAVFAIGILQAAARVPGVGRVGVTVTAARLLGCERAEAARLALLLSIPQLAWSAAALTWSLRGRLVVSPDLAGAAGVAALVGLMATAALMAWVRHNTFTPFAAWRIGLGAALLAWAAWV